MQPAALRRGLLHLFRVHRDRRDLRGEDQPPHAPQQGGGLYTPNPVVTRSSKTPGFTTLANPNCDILV
jgi:hypothetical protein